MLQRSDSVIILPVAAAVECAVTRGGCCYCHLVCNEGIHINRFSILDRLPFHHRAIHIVDAQEISDFSIRRNHFVCLQRNIIEAAFNAVRLGNDMPFFTKGDAAN
ncbi:hypothetical protein D3C86_1571860 [compost metagenome]